MTNYYSSKCTANWRQFFTLRDLQHFFLSKKPIIVIEMQGTKLTFLARRHLAPKFSKVVAKAKKLRAIKKKDTVNVHV